MLLGPQLWSPCSDLAARAINLHLRRGKSQAKAFPSFRLQHDPDQYTSLRPWLLQIARENASDSLQLGCCNINAAVMRQREKPGARVQTHRLADVSQRDY